MNPVTQLPANLSERLTQYSEAKQALLDQRVQLDTDQIVYAAVLAPLLFEEGEWRLLFERRTSKVDTHKDEVSFPGGGVEPGDSDADATALREAWEEIGLPRENVHILGHLPVMKMFPFFQVTPVVAEIRKPSAYVLSEDEVSRVFTIPVAWLADPKNWHNVPIPHNGVDVPVLHYQKYDGEIVWGATAYLSRMLVGLIVPF